MLIQLHLALLLPSISPQLAQGQGGVIRLHVEIRCGDIFETDVCPGDGRSRDLGLKTR